VEFRGFRQDDFHRRCDRHPNTLTVILDTNGNIFGGFTPLEWESRPWNNGNKADPSLKSFLFTQKNPHSFPARRFALKAENKDKALECVFDRGPHFGDICVSDACDATDLSWTDGFGYGYINDTGLDGETFLTGSKDFKVKEIEIFEIIS
jgi:hypothetical protein